MVKNGETFSQSSAVTCPDSLTAPIDSGGSFLGYLLSMEIFPLALSSRTNSEVSWGGTNIPIDRMHNV